MRKIILIILLLFSVFLFITMDANSQSKEFVEIKRFAMKAVPDENGDFFISIEREGFLYACSYLPGHKLIGVIRGEYGGITIVSYDEEGKSYAMAYARGGRILYEILIGEEQASKIAEEILKEFRGRKNIFI